jgi:recombination protein RecA
MSAKEIVRALGRRKTFRRRLYLPTGSTLLNLALSDRVRGGWPMGKVVNLIGDSSSGKTFEALTALAEACQNPAFDNYHLILDDVECANEFDVARLFGKRLASRLESPAHGNSDVIEDWEDNVLTALENPCIYVLDSFDALTSEEETERTESNRQKRRAGKETDASYGTEKPKFASSLLRRIKSKVKKHDSLVIIISQTRDNIGWGVNPKTRSGGRALKFYSTVELWASCEKKVESRGRMIGVNVKVKISKNKLTGKLRDVRFPIYYEYGVDDIGSCIEFLLEEKARPDWLPVSKRLSSMIAWVENNDMEDRLRREVGRVWEAIEESIRLQRKSKYE